MVCVRFLRTQQRAKSQCIDDVLPPSAGFRTGHGYSHEFDSWLGGFFLGSGFPGAWVVVIRRRV